MIEGVGVVVLVADYDSRELGIHRNEGILVDEAADEGELML